MHDANDMELLRDYGVRNSETAFAEVVQRHIGLVYSAAFRHAGNAAHAEEITQAVFIILARKAARLRPDTVLEGWLYETTRLTALSFLRGERRRQFREQEAYMQSTSHESTNDVLWHQLSPLLDEAVSRLGKKDRDALILRFFKDKSVRDVAATMQVNEEAVQRRILRALEKLRKFFTKRGVSSTTVIIAGAISANSVQAAPVALAKAVTATAITKGVAASSSILFLVEGTLKILTYAKLKLASVATAGILLAGGAVTVVLSSNWPGDNLSPDQIFNRAQEKYASLTSYSDEGRTVDTLNGITNKTTFTIRLARPNFYRIEWEQNNGTAFPAAKTQAVWSAGVGDFFMMGFSNPTRTVREVALGGVPAVSSNVASTVPATFFKMTLSDPLGGPVSDEKRHADEKVEGVDCYVLASELNGTTKTLWIGKRDFLIHQIRTATSARAASKLFRPRPEIIVSLARNRFPGITSTETHMNIVINQSFSEADFDYQASTPFLK